MARIHPVLLSGGAGSRLWPLSREGMPKQFLPLVSDRTLFQEAALRVERSRDLRADPRHRQRWPPVSDCTAVAGDRVGLLQHRA